MNTTSGLGGVYYYMMTLQGSIWWKVRVFFGLLLCYWCS